MANLIKTQNLIKKTTGDIRGDGKNFSAKSGINDSMERISNYAEGIPIPFWKKAEEENKSQGKIIEIKDPEKIIAIRAVDKYRQMFDYLDYEPADDKITANELLRAYQFYNWPKILQVENNKDYCKQIVKKYDKSKKGWINFVEFTFYLEDLYTSLDISGLEAKKAAFMKSRDVFSKLFHWLDRNNDNFLEMSDMVFGISKVMLKDMDLKEVKQFYKIYDPNNTGKINEDLWLLGIVNGHLKNTFSDGLTMDSYLVNAKK